MAAVERVYSMIRRLSSFLGRHRKKLLCLAMLESWLLTLVYSLTSRQYALIACRFFPHTVMPQLSKFLSHSLAPPYRYILLNLVIVTIAVTSGIVHRGKHADTRMDSRLKQDVDTKHPIVRQKLSYADIFVEKPKYPLSSNPSKQGYPARYLEISEAIPSNPSLGMSGEAGPKDHRFPPNAIAIQENVLHSSNEEKSAPASYHIAVDDPIAKADTHLHLVHVDESDHRYSGTQPLQIEEDEGHSALSTEEFNAIADAFIVKIRNRMRLERQDSLRRKSGELA